MNISRIRLICRIVEYTTFLIKLLQSQSKSAQLSDDRTARIHVQSRRIRIPGSFSRLLSHLPVRVRKKNGKVFWLSRVRDRALIG